MTDLYRISPRANARLAVEFDPQSGSYPDEPTGEACAVCREVLTAFELAVAQEASGAPRCAACIETAAPARSLPVVLGTFQRWLHLRDPAPLYVTLATALAARMSEGDPLWVVMVGGSSRGKTETVCSVGGLSYARVTAVVTEAGLLSGTPPKERAKGATGGLLRELPEDGGLLVVKDFGCILSMPRERRATVLQALREIYDGHWTRPLGTGGGTVLEWRGRLGLLAAATGELDRAHGVLAALGERWLTVRLGDDDGARESARAVLRRGDTRRMRQELADTVRAFLGGIEPPRLRPPEPADEALLVALAELAATARSPVLRDTYRSREIELVPQAEGPGRIVGQLHKLLVCLDAIGVEHAEAREMLRRVALDCIPSPRREALECVYAAERPLSTGTVSLRLQLPRTTAERALEDLAAHGLLAREKAGDHETAANTWRPTEEGLALWAESELHPKCHSHRSGALSRESLRDISGEASLDEEDIPW